MQHTSNKYFNIMLKVKDKSTLISILAIITALVISHNSKGTGLFFSAALAIISLPILVLQSS